MRINCYFVGAPTIAKGIEDFNYLATMIPEANFYWFAYTLDLVIKNKYSKINFREKLHDAELLSVIKDEMDIFVNCSHYEGFCIPIAEAIRLHKRVISYELEEVAAVYKNYISYIPCFNLSAFVARLKKEINQKPNQKNLQTASHYVDKEYSPEQVSKRLLDIILG